MPQKMFSAPKGLTHLDGVYLPQQLHVLVQNPCHVREQQQAVCFQSPRNSPRGSVGVAVVSLPHLVHSNRRDDGNDACFHQVPNNLRARIQGKRWSRRLCRRYLKSMTTETFSSHLRIPGHAFWLRIGIGATVASQHRLAHLNTKRWWARCLLSPDP